MGTSTTVAYSAYQTASGILVITGVKATTVSAPLVAAFSATGSTVGAMNSALVSKIAGLKVVEVLAVKSALASKSVIVILGVPIAREVALAAGLLTIVIVGGYAYFLLNDNVDKEEVLELSGAAT